MVQTKDDDPDDETKLHPKRVANPAAKCPRHGRKDYRRLIQAAWDAGWWCERGSDGYIKCWPPDAKRMVPIPATPSGTRTIDNKRAQFKRSGLDV